MKCQTTQVSRGAARVGIALLLFMAVSGCTLTAAREIYIGYPGPIRPDEEVATLLLKEADWVMIDRDGIHLSKFYAQIKLLPGEHHLEWSETFVVSVLVNPEMEDSAVWGETVTLEANHTYLVRGNRSTGPGYQMFLWIEDAGTGEIIAGRKKPSRMTEAQKRKAAERENSGQ